MPAVLTGANLIAGQERTAGDASILSVEARTGHGRPPAVHEATAADVAEACAAAAGAAGRLAALDPMARAALLEAVADRLDRAGDEIVALADAETALGREPRLAGELARTTGQLRFLAGVVRDGSYLEAIIDREPDVRRVLVPLGPVAVFGASNFPLAFSVAGGDTAAALAVGCPVVIKAHPSHPHTCELVGRQVAAALADAGAPAGGVSLIHGLEAGRRLVLDAGIRAVAFTGSLAGGTALAGLAASRDVPIPVYAEMGSLNPVVVTARAAGERPDEIAAGFVASMTLGNGQFCTKPGLVFVPDSPAGAALVEAISRAVQAAGPGVLLNAAIRAAWARRLQEWAGLREVRVLVAPRDDGAVAVRPALLETTAAGLVANPPLREECFGPAAILVRYRDRDDLAAALTELPGSLTATVHGATVHGATVHGATVHGATDESDDLGPLLDTLAALAGRVIWNGWPTGVAVNWAMQHGGPYPATTNPLHTSVGATSLRRFLRPVAYQGVPDELLPPALRDANPLGLPRRVDGALAVMDPAGSRGPPPVRRRPSEPSGAGRSSPSS
jgi:NADP-dependent aldehyde dehydrogenase